MATIPVSIRLSAAEFDALEAIAARKGITVRQLLQGHVRASLRIPRVVRPVRSTQTSQFTDDDIAMWVMLAERGITNNEIAAMAGVSKSLVSRYLIDRGVRRNQRRKTA